MKQFRTIILTAAAIASVGICNAQGLKGLGNALKKGVQEAAQSAVSSATSGSSSSKSSSKVAENNGNVFYVSKSGSARADGKTPATAVKDIQKAIDNASDGDIIRVAEGNYLGKLDAGYIEINKWITLEGGWNADFTERNILKYQTKIEPGKEQLGTNTNKGVIHFSGLDFKGGVYEIHGTVIVDGILINLGFETAYKPNDPSDERNGCPNENFETGRMLDDPQSQPSHQIFFSDQAISGNVIIRNCLIANGPYFGIQINSRCGEVRVYNNVIICNRYGGVRIDGWDRDGFRSHVNFHHNTVAYSWCRDKVMEDMGYGYEFMNRINADVHHNIFACNNYAAVARTRIDSEKTLEAKKVTNLYDNLFFLNAADLQLPSKGGGKWTNVPVARFDEVDETILPKYEGNKAISPDDPFVKALDDNYLKAFTDLKVFSSSSVDANSAANLYRQAHGMNMRGSETIRVSMYGNRYNYEKALQLFGAREDYGAQLAE